MNAIIKSEIAKIAKDILSTKLSDETKDQQDFIKNDFNIYQILNYIFSDFHYPTSNSKTAYCLYEHDFDMGVIMGFNPHQISD